jgi:hypothetical protein
MHMVQWVEFVHQTVSGLPRSPVALLFIEVLKTMFYHTLSMGLGVEWIEAGIEIIPHISDGYSTFLGGHRNWELTAMHGFGCCF